MKFFYLILLFASSGFCTLQAQTSLVIQKNDGTAQKQAITNQTTIKFTENNMVVYENNVELLTISTEEMRWFFYDSPVGIKFAEPAEKTALTLKQNGNNLIIGGLKKETPVTLYHMNGKQCLSRTVSSAGVLNIERQPAGIYFLKVENVVYKFIKK